jgi:Rrf2 family protein
MTSSMYGAGVEYALHSLLILAAQSEPASIRDLAGFQKIPERFLARVFTRLVKAKIVEASEGIAGGFVLARPAHQIPIGDVVEAVDPGRTLFACAEIRRNCVLFDASPPSWSISGMCQIHSFMSKAERELRTLLASKTLADIGHEVGKKAPAVFIKESEIWFEGRRASRTTRRKER